MRQRNARKGRSRSLCTSALHCVGAGGTPTDSPARANNGGRRRGSHGLVVPVLSYGGGSQSPSRVSCESEGGTIAVQRRSSNGFDSVSPHRRLSRLSPGLGGGLRRKSDHLAKSVPRIMSIESNEDLGDEHGTSLEYFKRYVGLLMRR